MEQPLAYFRNFSATKGSGRRHGVQRRHRRLGLDYYNIPIRVGGIELIATQSDTYDLVTLTELVEHTPDPVEFLKTVNHVLKSGGYALVTFPDISALKSKYYRFLTKATRRNWMWITCHIPLHIWEFTYETAKATFEKSGFSVVGFRRVELNDELTGRVSFLSWPVRLLHSGPLARRFGSQMEFVIRKNE